MTLPFGVRRLVAAFESCNKLPHSKIATALWIRVLTFWGTPVRLIPDCFRQD